MHDEINSIVGKFDTLKEDVETFNKRQSTFAMDRESKQAQIQLLETQIQNIQLLSKVREKTKEDIEMERNSLNKQIETFKNLKGALEQQIEALA